MLNLQDQEAFLRSIQQTAKAFPVLSWSVAFLGLLSVSLALPRPFSSPIDQGQRGRLTLAITVPLSVLIAVSTVILIFGTGVRPEQADALYKAAAPYDQSGQWEMSIKLYEYAIQLAPHEDFYHIFLARAPLEQATEETDPSQREEWLTQTQETLERAHSLNPLNADHLANLARFHRRAADFAGDAVARERHLQTADSYYTEATALAPQNIVLLNEWAMLKWYFMYDEEQACDLLERSLEMDPAFEQTQQLYTDICPQTLPEQPVNLDFED
jgi:tetratricopeptide (TPR) repeat protein